MQATLIAPSLPSVPVKTGRRVLAGGVYRPGERPAPVVVTCVWCGKPIEAEQQRERIGFGVLHNEPAVPCVAEFEDMAYGSGRVR